MKLGYTILYVDDVETTLAFYEAAFGLRRRMIDDSKNYGEVDTGETRLGFVNRTFVAGMVPVPLQVASRDGAAPPVELGMVTDDVDAAFRQALAAGAVKVKAPETKPWGQIVGYVRDPNGFL